MKFKILAFSLLTVLIITFMWHYSPKREYILRPYVETIIPKSETIYDSVVSYGRVKETVKESIRLDRSAIIDTVYVSVGDFVKEGSVLFDIDDKEVELSDVTSGVNFFSEFDDISDVANFYVPKSFNKTTLTTPQIKAPISGVITNVSVKAGDVALGYVPVITISDFDSLCVETSVTELYIKEIEIGQKAEVTGEAFGGKKYIGYVSEISPIATKEVNLTGNGETTVSVTISGFSNNKLMRPGCTVTTKILTDVHEKALTVPYTSVFQEDRKEYVYVVKGDRIVKTAIRTGFELDDRVEITSGIAKSDIIIKNASEKLYDNMLIKVRE